MRLADRASRVYAPAVHLTAALTFAGWLIAGASVHDAVITAIAVLIITCPCALALAIPAVQVVAWTGGGGGGSSTSPLFGLEGPDSAATRTTRISARAPPPIPR